MQREHSLKFLRSLGSGYGSICLVDNGYVGLVLLGLTFLHPNSGWAGLAGAMASLFWSSLLRIQSEAYQKTVLYNGVLVGLFIGHQYLFNWYVLGLILVSTGVSLLFAAAIGALFYTRGLPILSLPFSLTATLIAFSKSSWTIFVDAAAANHEFALALPVWLTVLFRSLGAIFCIPDPLVGVLILILVLVASPLLAMFLVTGFMLGYGIDGLVHVGPRDPLAVQYFNPALSFVALGLIFVIPSRKSIVIAFVAAVLTSFLVFALGRFWGGFGIPIAPFPFNLAVLTTLLALRWLLPEKIENVFPGLPESTLERRRLFRLRQRSGEIGLFCPFEGRWRVLQGFNGKWTHRGLWRHALDFVVADSFGKTFSRQGFDLADYYAFGKPVLSPVDGQVVHVHATQSDNVIGTVDNENNWGNHIILRAHAGFYVVLAHLKHASVKVQVGDVVLAGRPLAECGNSGYSVEPHLHVQVQWIPYLGSPSLPFHLINYLHDGEFIFRGIPQQGAEIGAPRLNVALDRAMSFRIGDVMEFKDTQTGTSLKVAVKLDDSTGTTYLSQGGDRLSFGRLKMHHYFYAYEGRPASFLADLFGSAPRIPLVFGEPLRFVDVVPAFLKQGRWGRLAEAFRELFGIQSRDSWIRYLMDPAKLEILGPESRLQLDPMVGILKFCLKGREYVRIIEMSEKRASGANGGMGTGFADCALPSGGSAAGESSCSHSGS